MKKSVSSFHVNHLHPQDDDDDSSVSSLLDQPAQEERDEIEEVQRFTKQETLRLRRWRIIVTLVLLLTAAVVTFVTYRSIRREEEKKFRATFDELARSLGDAAAESRRDTRDAYKALAENVMVNAKNQGTEWPFYQPRDFDVYAKHMTKQSGVELFSLNIVVEDKDLTAWNQYVEENYVGWLEQGHKEFYGDLSRYPTDEYAGHMVQLTPNGPMADGNRTLYYPHAVVYPPAISMVMMNLNLPSIPDYAAIVEAIKHMRTEAAATRVRPYAVAVGAILTPEEHDSMHDKLPEGEVEHPHSIMWYPLFEDAQDPNSKMRGVLSGGIAWDRSLRNLLPETVEGVIAAIENNCNQSYTYEINGKSADFVGTGEVFDERYKDMEIKTLLSVSDHPDFETTPGHCIYSMRVFPSQKLEDSYMTNTPLINAAIVALTFVAVAVSFFIYDMFVQQRNNKIIENAALSNAVVTQTFPGKLRDKMIADAKGRKKDVGERHDTDHSDQLAELHLEASVIFADISGFSAWSSSREPHQVFSLLGAVFACFDSQAHRRRILKVETVGDCYVATAGLPNYRKDHAVIMARFARALLHEMSTVTKQLELKLGPDTSDLSLRIGIHCGPITAGVLRGERARFQLFGDTVNTASRIQTSAPIGKIQVSEAFANLLAKAGKGDWVTPREGGVQAKGKGILKTYILHNQAKLDTSVQSTAGSSSVDDGEPVEVRTNRLIDWCCEALADFLGDVIQRRGNRNVPPFERAKLDRLASTFGSDFQAEVKEIITLPEYSASMNHDKETKAELPEQVKEELRAYVSTIAFTYRENEFHSFEHCSHVLMSVKKLMSRIHAPKGLADDDALHDHTYGITSDPLTQFACGFSALIHDVDHYGVPNTQLLKEEASICPMYKHRSVAEQNSLDIAWNLLMSNDYSTLRAAIYTDEAELYRFRSLVVNSVMATEIVDKDLKILRNKRWNTAFEEQVHDEASPVTVREAANRKATIVIEHLIQASDVCHTMQHWHVYRKWNKRFFRECYKAWQDGRADCDPSIGWYKGELGFFDFYIIPLAKKLRDCGVFGISSDEYLQYALKNRKEWEDNGQEIVAEMIEALNDNNNPVVGERI